MIFKDIKSIKQTLFTGIKFISIPLITAGMGLEIWNIETITTNNQLPNILNPVLILAHIALSAHFVEGIIAAFYAPSKNHNPIKYAIYTFFVGTVGLLELWENRNP
jgi:RsiW-degrading membrane proteinase PrsW (M82 family)